MGGTISNLVFRPPRPTKIKPDRFFYIEVEPPDSASSFKFTCSPTCVPDSASISMSSTHSDDDTAGGANDNQDPSTSSSGSTSNCLRIPAFFLLRRGAKITILYSHGNAEDLGMMYRRMKELARVLCVNVLAYDYSGYGLSQPRGIKPTEQLCYRNIEAAYNYLVNVMKIPPSNIVLYGRSLGSGPSCHLAKKTAQEGKSVAGLILHSPFLSIYRIVVDVKSGIVGDMFRSYTTAKDIKCPVFVIHGKEDAVVPFWHGDELLRSFPPQYRAQPFWVPNMGHNNIEVKWKKEYIERVIQFLTKYCQGGDGEAGDECARTGSEVPVKDRYMPDWSLNEAGKFLVNQTWVKHGPTIVQNAVKVTKDNSNSNKRATKASTTTSNPNSKDKGIYRDRDRTRPSTPQTPSVPAESQQNHQIPYQQSQQQQERLDFSHSQVQTQMQMQQQMGDSSHTSLADTDKKRPIEFGRKRTASILAKLLREDDSSLNKDHGLHRTTSTTSQYIETQESWATEEDINNLTFDSKVCIGGNQLQTSPAALALEFLQQQQEQYQKEKKAHSKLDSRSTESLSLSGEKRMHTSNNAPLDNLTNRHQTDGSRAHSHSHSPDSRF